MLELNTTEIQAVSGAQSIDIGTFLGAALMGAADQIGPTGKVGMFYSDGSILTAYYYEASTQTMNINHYLESTINPL